ncbi:MAG: hypothetical protein WC815_04565 [Vicinamibacterales bacterium]|jgi:hypothetical protein
MVVLQRSRRVLAAAVVAALIVSPVLHAQMAHRLKGSIRTDAGVPLNQATIRADVLSGFRGEPFAGQKEHRITSTDKGEWSMAGIEAGLWLFSTSAPDMLPAVIVLPVKFSQRQQVSAVGNSLTWQLPLWASPASEHPMLKIAADLLAAGKKDEAAQALTVALGPDVPAATRVAAGEMALLALQPSLARTIFAMVLQADPKHPRALVGSASAALLGRDWETAGKVLWAARDLAPKEQRQALASAIGDLQGISRVQ